MLCLGHNVFQYALENQIIPKYIMQLYYPQLENFNVNSQDTLLEKKQELHENYKSEYNNWLKHRNEMVDLYHEIYLTRKSTSNIPADLPYKEKGVQNISLRTPGLYLIKGMVSEL